jgi:hypothetical protein
MTTKNKYTEAMPTVRASVLYKSLCKAFRKQDHDELLRQLVWAYVDYTGRNTHFDLDAENVYRAFRWSASPQGFDFWWSVHEAWECA